MNQKTWVMDLAPVLMVSRLPCVAPSPVILSPQAKDLVVDSAVTNQFQFRCANRTRFFVPQNDKRGVGLGLRQQRGRKNVLLLGQEPDFEEEIGELLLSLRDLRRDPLHADLPPVLNRLDDVLRKARFARDQLRDLV